MFYLLFSCASLSPYLADPDNNPHPECSPKSNYVAIGRGSDPKSAISDAHRQISEQISSSIESESELISQYSELSVSSGKETDTTATGSEAFTSNILTKSQFKRNDLIKEKISPIEHDSTFYTLSCLNRREASKVLVADLAPQIQRVTQMCDTALDKGSSKDMAAFATVYNQIDKIVEPLIPDLYVVRSLTKRPSSEEVELRAKLSSVEDMATQQRASVSIGLEFSQTDLEEPDQQKIIDGVRLSLESLGLNSSDGSAECEKGLTHHALISAFSNCEKGPVGYMCRPSLKITFKSCASGKRVSIGVEDKKFSGQDYHSSEKALSEAISKSDRPIFVEDFYEELSSIIPLLSN